MLTKKTLLVLAENSPQKLNIQGDGDGAGRCVARSRLDEVSGLLSGASAAQGLTAENKTSHGDDHFYRRPEHHQAEEDDGNRIVVSSWQ